MPANKEPLGASVEELERVLAEEGAPSGPDWAKRVDRALSLIESAVCEHQKTLESSEGRVINVESPRMPSPTVDRRLAELQRDLEEFLKETRALRTNVQAAGCPPQVASNPDNLAGAL